MKKIILIFSLLLVSILTVNLNGVYASAEVDVILTDINDVAYSEFTTSFSYVYDDSYDQCLSEQLDEDVAVVKIVDVSFIYNSNNIYSIENLVEPERETIKVKIPLDIDTDKYEISLYVLNGEVFEFVEANVDEDYIVYATERLQPVFVVAKAVHGLNAWMIIVACVVLVLLLILLCYYFKMRRDLGDSVLNAKNKELKLEE